MDTLYSDPFFTSVDGSTGLLRMDTQGRIHRDLPFAQFRGGSVEPIEDAQLLEPDENPLPEPIEFGAPSRPGSDMPQEPFEFGE